MRLAWFSPWPPERSGIAGRSAELVPLLQARGHAIDVYVNGKTLAAAAATGAAVAQAHDFLPRHVTRPYDLVVYQLGNSWLHEFIWPYAFRFPGLAVLHDARLHHARGHASLARADQAGYRAEFAWSTPDVSPNAAELAVHGFDGAYYYQWPMTRAVVDASRLTAVHARAAAAELARQHPDRAIEHVALGEGVTGVLTSEARRAARGALGFTDADIVFGVFGGLTPDKRIDPILRAFATTVARTPAAKLLLAGTPHVWVDVDAMAAALNIGHAVRVVPALDDAGFDAAVASVDVSLHLRWPTALEMSGPWLRALSAARPTIITDLTHLADVPALDPRSWRPQHASGAPPIAVAIDVLDEDHSLRRAMHRLADDAALRAALGAAARDYWQAHHTVDRMVGDYERAIARAATLAAPGAALPASLRPDPYAYASEIAGQTGRPCALP